MPTETGRHRLYEKIKEQWGEDHAAELMSYLPPVGWADVATKQDTAHLRADLDTQAALLRAEMATLGSDLRAEMATLGSDLRAEMATLGSDLRAEMATLGSDLRVEIAGLRTTQATELRNHLYWIIGTMIGLTGLVSIIVGWLG